MPTQKNTFSPPKPPSSQLTAHWSQPSFTFSAKERDTETGLRVTSLRSVSSLWLGNWRTSSHCTRSLRRFGSRYYSSDLSIWLSVDPQASKYPGLSPFTYCANNPVKLVDPNGEEISTHIDKDGNVLAVYNDANTGIYKHNSAEITDFYNGKNFSNNYDNLIGFTFCEQSFKQGDRININSNEAELWLNSFESNFANAVSNPLGSLLFYAMNAGNGDLYDVKSHMNAGSMISEGVYVSPRDLGNYAAGAFGRLVGLSKTRTLASYGAFQLAGNQKKEFFFHYGTFYQKALNTFGEGLYLGQKTYGEDGISNFFQRLGYEGINTINKFELRYSTIWED